jgi:hypothetical protein
MLLSSFRTRIVDCIKVSVVIASIRIVFISAYRPGGRSTSDDISKLRDDILQLTSSRNSFFIRGTAQELTRLGMPFLTVLTNGFHDMEHISTHTALTSDHLPVLFEVTTNVRREIPSHLVFDYQNSDWCRLDLDLSLDRIERETQIDSLVQNFTETILEVRSLSVPLVRPNRYCQAQNLTEECSLTNCSEH